MDTTEFLNQEEKSLVLTGVRIQPMRDDGICSNCRDNATEEEPHKTSLWLVRWGDGVVMPLCTPCMASLVFEETLTRKET